MLPNATLVLKSLFSNKIEFPGLLILTAAKPAVALKTLSEIVVFAYDPFMPETAAEVILNIELSTLILDRVTPVRRLLVASSKVQYENVLLAVLVAKFTA